MVLIDNLVFKTLERLWFESLGLKALVNRTANKFVYEGGLTWVVVVRVMGLNEPIDHMTRSRARMLENDYLTRNQAWFKI